MHVDLGGKLLVDVVPNPPECLLDLARPGQFRAHGHRSGLEILRDVEGLRTLRHHYQRTSEVLGIFPERLRHFLRYDMTLLVEPDLAALEFLPDSSLPQFEAVDDRHRGSDAGKREEEAPKVLDL